MPITLAESQLTIFPWVDRNDYLTKSPNSRFTDGDPACTITFNVFRNDQMVVLHIPCNTLFSLEAFRKSFDSRKVCPTCNRTINESDLVMLSEKINRLIETLKGNLLSKRKEEEKFKKSLVRLNKTEDTETPISLSKKPLRHEQRLKELAETSASSNSSVIFAAALEALSKEIIELDEKIQALEILEKRVIRENFYKPYIPKIKILALLIISVFLAKYFFRTTVNLCNDLQ
ncbi:MAG: hypothetical protein KR126chlam6_00521 [Candidatus Anoxychlamydiales bacterium]|nr:hypothetical protein [Candidatus Anoxychlamydiales bacterium]